MVPNQEEIEKPPSMSTIKEIEEDDRYDIKSGTLKKIDSSLMMQISQKEGIIHSLISLPQ